MTKKETVFWKERGRNMRGSSSCFTLASRIRDLRTPQCSGPSPRSPSSATPAVHTGLAGVTSSAATLDGAGVLVGDLTDGVEADELLKTVHVTAGLSEA